VKDPEQKSLEQHLESEKKLRELMQQKNNLFFGKSE
jgi:hypothetical protein